MSTNGSTSVCFHLAYLRTLILNLLPRFVLRCISKNPGIICSTRLKKAIVSFDWVSW